jgi:hypothetical protein
LGAGEYGVGLGGTGADHPDLDTGLRRHRGAGGDYRDGQRDPAVSDGGFGTADGTHTTDKTVSSGAGDAFHRGHLVGRCFRLLPQVPRERRVAFTHGLGTGVVSVCLIANAIGYTLAANLPQLFAAAVLLLTPLAFLLSTARNCRQLADILALVLGLALFPLAATLHTGVDILISGMSAGTIAYGVHWWREHDPEKWNPVFREDHAQNERTLESDSTQLNQTRARE